MQKQQSVNYCYIMPTRAPPFTNYPRTQRHTVRYLQQCKIRNEEANIGGEKNTTALRLHLARKGEQLASVSYLLLTFSFT